MRRSISAFRLICLLGSLFFQPALADERALLKAAKANDTRSVLALLDAGADPNGRGAQGETPLMAAALHGNIKVAKALLQARADCGLSDKLDRTALWIAAAGSQTELVALLAKQDCAQATINLADEQSRSTALHMAISTFVKASGLRALVRGGASLTAKNWLGQTPPATCKQTAKRLSRCRSAGIL
ncbi:ankyrin repeat domain-containing protein [Tabrizicola sp.]|uniref:ankyrin repeat domain-containing protein n=1 Tax=Tabrizicola sp. TaxID=2005166 RepID=UPI002732503E|nr:ankyrin repeat domain-containing protein [Tabrizicola sp.]MDP3194620.1 ankyrin repeat domain-containing protein [Tabrizicola sp.]